MYIVSSESTDIYLIEIASYTLLSIGDNDPGNVCLWKYYLEISDHFPKHIPPAKFGETK